MRCNKCLVSTAHMEAHLWHMFAFVLDTPPPPKTSMTMEHSPFEDVVPIENVDFPTSC